ncbi:DUF3489 domain-containing protein [Lichenibacterium dinghuense]|uniref:DUF3489 domain-containing protein n=1 Tax=Lichenibacterium dinghuense TaxID=2895977 RepID=UPI001F48533A|nr:DUF3489 domain-containing protein [Lichenibacterium sp. 6Y81]
MPTPLTDAHLALLRAAIHHPDCLLIPPDRLLGAARARMAARLVALGMAVPVAVTADGPKWLAEPDGSPTGLKLTEAGHSAASPGPVQEPAAVVGSSTDGPDAAGPMEGIPGGLRPPRVGSKAALLLDLVARDGGATLNSIADALGWQCHTVRAALTRLRQGGTPIERVAGEDGRSLYRLAVAHPRPNERAMGTADAQDGAA